MNLKVFNQFTSSVTKLQNTWKKQSSLLASLSNAHSVKSCFTALGSFPYDRLHTFHNYISKNIKIFLHYFFLDEK